MKNNNELYLEEIKGIYGENLEKFIGKNEQIQDNIKLYFDIKNNYDWYIKMDEKNIIRVKGAKYLAKNYGKARPGITGVGGEGGCGGESEIKIKYYDIDKLKTFDYKKLFLETKPDKKFNKARNIPFNLKFYSKDFFEVYEEYHKMYENLEDWQLDFIDDIYKKLSTYIRENEISEENRVDASVIPVISLIISRYLETGKLQADGKFIEAMDENEINSKMNTFSLFLINQCFTSKQERVNLCEKDIVREENHLINLIRKRISGRPMCSKGLLPSFMIEDTWIVPEYKGERVTKEYKLENKPYMLYEGYKRMDGEILCSV